MTKLKYRLQEGEEIMDENHSDFSKSIKELDEKYYVIKAIVKKRILTKKVKKTVKRQDDAVTKLVKKTKK